MTESAGAISEKESVANNNSLLNIKVLEVFLKGKELVIIYIVVFCIE
jgi:hypothetical protein